MIFLIDFLRLVFSFGVTDILWDSEMSKLLWNGNACPSFGLVKSGL